jgi:hypothetical protein
MGVSSVFVCDCFIILCFVPFGNSCFQQIAEKAFALAHKFQSVHCRDKRLPRRSAPRNDTSGAKAKKVARPAVSFPAGRAYAKAITYNIKYISVENAICFAVF